MKKTQITFGILLFLAAIYPLAVLAEVALENNAELIGAWTLESTAKDLDGEKRPSGQTWEFKKDGTLATAGYDRRLPGGNFSVNSTYEVKDGKIVADVVGRPGKKTTYTVIEKQAGSMILKHGIGEYMFFFKK